jgi:glutamine---fructose-6-phosphate transaminase (isomerizing)
MCGIVGFIGTRPAKPILLEGLLALEYRGYDSAGIALLTENNSEFLVRRSVGPVAGLVAATQGVGELEVQGIAHTRWATHGVPTEINAHPHRAGDLVLVHNGIVENYAELREELISHDVQFESQTDTEVLAQLIEFYRKQKTIEKGVEDFQSAPLKVKREIVLEALHTATQKTHGHYSAIFIVLGLESELYGIQNGAPLVAASFADGLLVASDLQAILPYEKNVMFLNPGTILHLADKKITTLGASDLKPLKVEITKIEWSQDKVEKEGFEHFMLKEIHQQPMVIADTLSGRLPIEDSASFIWDNPKAHEALWKNAKRVVLVACGTSFYAAMVSKYYFERWARISVEVDLASEFRYRQPVLEAGTVVGFISQSGETADTLAALRMVNEMGLTTFSICNVPGSSIIREAAFEYSTKAGPEIGVASTKAFTAQLTVLAALALDVANLRGTPKAQKEELRSQMLSLARLPHDMERVLARADDFKKLGASLATKKTLMYLGRGAMFPISLEGALKVKEISYIHAEGYAAGELKHGPIAMVDKDLAAIVLAPNDEFTRKTLSNLEEIKTRSCTIVGVGDEDNKDFKSLCDIFVGVPKCSSVVAPMVYVLVMQLLAYGLAHELGREIDKPRNLAKSVTVE